MGSPRRQQCTQGAPHLPANLSPARGARGGALQHLPCPGDWKGCIRLGCGTPWAGGWGSCPRTTARAEPSAHRPERPCSLPHTHALPRLLQLGPGLRGSRHHSHFQRGLGGQKRHVQSGGSWALLHFSCKGQRESSPVTPTPSVTSQGGSRGGYRGEGGVLVPLNPCIASLSSSPRHPPRQSFPLTHLFAGLTPGSKTSWLGRSAFCTGLGSQVGQPGGRASLKLEAHLNALLHLLGQEVHVMSRKPTWVGREAQPGQV